MVVEVVVHAVDVLLVVVGGDALCILCCVDQLMVVITGLQWELKALSAFSTYEYQTALEVVPCAASSPEA